jgi:murein DD-endopeptidase MepM/ murein hydrolase activator NlpD
MKSKYYTFFIASSDSSGVRRMRIPFFLVHLLTILAIVGGITVIAAVGSYSRMLWKVTNYNALRRDQDNLKKQYRQLQTEVRDTNQRLASLQSLASEVAMTYGITRVGQGPFAPFDESAEPDSSYQQSLAQFNFLEKNASAIALVGQGLHLLPGSRLAAASYVPSLWPVMGSITGTFGERMDPFSGEGAFHRGVDIASRYGDEVRAAADGVVVSAEIRAGYGRLVIVDHGFGVSTWYGHLSAFSTQVGTHVKRGEALGFEGRSGRSTGAHVHYEVRIYNTPVNPWRYLRGTTIGD